MFELFEQLIEENKKANPEKPEDYRVNGLLYCGKCHAPRQQENNLMGTIFKPYIPCLCMLEEERKEKEREDEIKRMMECMFKRLDHAVRRRKIYRSSAGTETFGFGYARTERTHDCMVHFADCTSWYDDSDCGNHHHACKPDYRSFHVSGCRSDSDCRYDE